MPHYQKVQTVKELWASFIFPFLSAMCYVKKLTYSECCWLQCFWSWHMLPCNDWSLCTAEVLCQGDEQQIEKCLWERKGQICPV